MARFTLAFGLAMLALFAASASAGRELLQRGCANLTPNAIATYNAEHGTAHDFACFETDAEEMRCGGLPGGLCAFSGGVSCFYRAKPCKPSDNQVLALFDAWNAALATKDPVKVADMYAAEAVLLPTVSNQYRDTRELIIDYFVEFLQKEPQGAIDMYEIRHLADGVVQNMGIYTFTLKGGAQVQARYSYTYVRQADGKWLIAEHHSSAMPEDVVGQIKQAFLDWNAALATGEPSKVAAMYAPNAVLLPTVSDMIRNTPAEIEAYFVDFLKKEPSGIVDEIAGSTPNIRLLAPNVAVHSGSYVFTLKNDDGTRSRVRARFTYVLKKYGKKWLIEEHHSSANPQVSDLGVVPPS